MRRVQRPASILSGHRASNLTELMRLACDVSRIGKLAARSMRCRSAKFDGDTIGVRLAR
jgi:hypothetical protein